MADEAVGGEIFALRSRLQLSLAGRLWRGMPYQPRPLQKSIKRCDVLHRGKACDKRLNTEGNFAEVSV